MRSLRSQVLLGAVLWTLGLLAVGATALTFHRSAFQFLAVVHFHPNALMIGAALCMAAGFAVVRAGFTPLREMRRRLADVQRGTARQLSGDYPAEVGPLVQDLNALLGHHEAAVSRALAKAGDLAHGLKTPLAVLSQEAQRAAAAGQIEIAAAIGEQVERMRRQIEYHLAHARAAASGATPGAHCAVAVSAEGLSRTLLRLHAERAIAIDVHVPADHAVRCRREDLDEMLGNLLDNACKWARARVTVTSSRVLPPDRLRQGYGGPPKRSAEAEGGSHEKGRGSQEEGPVVAIMVEDDGPGLAPSMLEAVLQRGVRADEAAPGSGFGLAIVRDLAELYGGSIALETAPTGGLRASLRLPGAPR
jgi:signal transduction histidine kinase